MDSLSAYPHIPTPAGAAVGLKNAEGTFRVLSSFVTGRDVGRPKNAYLLQDAGGQLCTAINGWLTVEGWPSERLHQLQAAGQELADLRAALRVAAGEQ